MPILPQVGRRSWRLRAVIGAIYGALCLGSVTMVYPFLLMLSSSVTSVVDFPRFRVVPEYVYDTDALMAKYVGDKYSEWSEWRHSYRERFFGIVAALSSSKNDFPAFEVTEIASRPTVRRQVEDWYAFKETLPWRYKSVHFFNQYSFTNVNAVLTEYRAFLEAEYDGDIARVNAAYHENNAAFGDLVRPSESVSVRCWIPPDTPKWRDWCAFRTTLAPRFQYVISTRAHYANFLFSRYLDVALLNKECNRDWPGFDDVPLPTTLPKDPEFAAIWADYAKTSCPLRFLKPEDTTAPAFRAFLEERYGDTATLNRRWDTAYNAFGDIPFPRRQPAAPRQAMDWAAFVRNVCPPERLEVQSSESLYARYLKTRYGTLDAANAAYGTACPDWDALDFPRIETDAVEVAENRWGLTWDFASRNYIAVVRILVTQGRAFFNTILLVVGFLVLQLTINPLAAFALSRFRLSYAPKILIFLLGTMAFPAAVGMVPNFLLLKQLHLLNTYWAILLPVAANGYFIFILKSYFDTLPEELFETAHMEGAGRMWMFFNIAVALSKPVFAVIALAAFAAAYGSFMWALVVCQEQKMWTIMVYLQQLSLGAPPQITMAALTLAAIPSLVVFILFQRVIIRGIVVPQLK